jgi:hypothetical protein
MTATFVQLITRARSFVRDEGASFIDDDDLGNWINEAYRDIAARLPVMQRTDTGTATGLINLPTTNGTFTVEILGLRFGSSEVEFVNDAVFDSWAGAAPPTMIARVWQNQIEVSPTPDLDDYELKIAFIPAELVQPGDVHVLPIQLERKLVEYAVSQAKLKDEDFASSDRWFIKYEQGLPQVSTSRSVQQPGPLSLGLEPSYFDLDALRHRSTPG